MVNHVVKPGQTVQNGGLYGRNPGKSTWIHGRYGSDLVHMVGKVWFGGVLNGFTDFDTKGASPSAMFGSILPFLTF